MTNLLCKCRKCVKNQVSVFVHSDKDKPTLKVLKIRQKYRENHLRKKNVENTNNPQTPMQPNPAVACLLSAKTNAQDAPLPTLTPGFVCGVARGAKNFYRLYSVD